MMQARKDGTQAEYLDFSLPSILGDQRRMPFIKEFRRPVTDLDGTDPTGVKAPHPMTRAAFSGFPTMTRDESEDGCS